MFSVFALPSVKALMKAHLYNNQTVFALAGAVLFLFKKRKMVLIF